MPCPRSETDITAAFEAAIGGSNPSEGARPEVADEYKTAFLLQFARERQDISCFPAYARRLIADITKRYPMEIDAFDAIENWDYILYGLANHEETGNDLLLMEVIDTHAPIMDALRERLPGVREEIWTDDMRDWCMDFLAERKRLMPEVEAKIRS